jgi:hypothetical protein
MLGTKTNSLQCLLHRNDLEYVQPVAAQHRERLVLDMSNLLLISLVMTVAGAYVIASTIHVQGTIGDGPRDGDGATEGWDRLATTEGVTMTAGQQREPCLQV